MFSLLAFPVLAQTSQPGQSTQPTTARVVHQINWQTGFLEITVEQPIEEQRSNAPARLFRTQQEIEQAFPRILFESVLPLRIDSVKTVEDAVRTTPAISSRLTELSTFTERGLPRPDQQLTSLSQQFRVPIFPNLAELFVSHQIPFRMERVVRWVPTENFSGLVIYAAGAMPHRGTGESTLLEAALLPEIYDTTLRPVLEQDMLDPEALRRWGVVAYSEDFDEDRWRHRIGPNPYRIMAREVFGLLPTDILISPEDADRLLSSSHNRNMLREGRILVIVAPGQTIDR